MTQPEKDELNKLRKEKNELKEGKDGVSTFVHGYNALLSTIIVLVVSFQFTQSSHAYDRMSDRQDKLDEKVQLIQIDIAALKGYKDTENDDRDNKDKTSVKPFMILPNNKSKGVLGDLTNKD